MQVKIWGAQGSHPSPMTPGQFQKQVTNIVQRIRPADITDDESRERFINSLPEWLWELLGGNTSCVELRLSDNTCIIFDAGTGIIPLARHFSREEPEVNVFHLFFSHFHYDHIQGLPFFLPAYKPGNVINFYSPKPNMEAYIRNHMKPPYFPVTMEAVMVKQQHFHILSSDDKQDNVFSLSNAKIYWKMISHPGDAYAYKVVENGKTVIFATDFGLSRDDFTKTKENSEFFKDADVLILDTMYSLGEAIEKPDWGHSSFIIGVDFAIAWNIKRLLLFHHDPQYDDKHLLANLQSARYYAQVQNAFDLSIDIAREGMVVDLH